MKIQKIPSLKCNKCGSYCVMLVNNIIVCDDCNRITAKESEVIKREIKKAVKNFYR